MCRGSEPRKLGLVVRGELDWLVMKPLEKDRNRRYESVSAFAADIERYLNNEPVQACPPSAAYRLRKFLRRNKGPVVAASLVLLTLVVGAVGTAIGLVRALAAEQLAKNRLTASEESLQCAEEQTAIAQAVTDFLRNDLLGQPDVANLAENYIYSVVRDPDVKVRTLLDRAAKAIEHKFRDQPLTEAAVRLALADAYRELGQDAEAQKHAKRAVALRSAKLGSDHPDTLTSRRKLGIMYRDGGKRDQGDALLAEVLETRTASLGPEHPQTLLSKTDQAARYFHEGDKDRAIAIFEDVLEKQTVKLSRTHPDTLQSIWSLAHCFQSDFKATRAEALFKEGMDICVAKLGPHAPTTLSLKKQLASLYRVYHELDRPLHICLELVPTCVAKLGPDHPLTLECKHELALLCAHSGIKAFDRAESLFGDVLMANSARYGSDHANTLITKQHLGGVYEAQCKYALAASLFQEVIDAQSSELGPDDPQTLVAKVRLANLWNNEARYDMSASLFEQVLEAVSKR
jgi:tetratricopeptide (TPR) repeat protein